MASTGVGSNMAYNTVTIGATAGLIKAGLSTRKSITIQNVHASQDLYLGPNSSVTTANGLKVPAGQSAIYEDYNGPVYGIASGAGTDVRYEEIY